MTEPTVLLADDHGAIREALRIMLEGKGIVVVGEAADGQTAVRNAAALRPDVVLMDLRMPRLDGVAATGEIVAGGYGEVLVLTSFDEDDLVLGAIRAGAAGFLLKTADAATLVEAVRTVARGEGTLDPAVTRRALAVIADGAERRGTGGSSRAGDPAGETDPAGERPSPRAQLTERERDVLDALGRGWSNAQIAERLSISVPTVKTHVSNVLAKLGASSRTQAVVMAGARRRD